MFDNLKLNSQYTKELASKYSKVSNNRAPPLIIFRKIFRTPPLLLEPPLLLIFDY